jgi:hypothetical protein
MQKGTYVLWRLMDKEEYDELMSRKLWYEVTKDEELLEFDFLFIFIGSRLHFIKYVPILVVILPFL